MGGAVVVVVSRRGGAIPEVVVLLPAIPAVVLKLLLLLTLPIAPPAVEPKGGGAAEGPPVAVDVLVLRVLRLEEERCRLREGVGWLDEGPRRPVVDRVFAELLAGSALPSVMLVDVEEVLETAEAVCCLKRVSSRVSRLTMASCSFSICMCRSAAVRGRGCRNGPGPGSVPVSSCRTGGWKKADDDAADVARVGERGGGVEEKRLADGEETREDRRRVSDGRRGLETAVAELRKGDGGRELISGAMVLWKDFFGVKESSACLGGGADILLLADCVPRGLERVVLKRGVAML